MNIKIYQDRKLLNEDNNFGSENENLATTLVFEFPEYIEKDGVQIATKDLNKTIVFDIEGDNELPIEEDKFSFPYEITKLGEVVWNICLKEKSETEDMTDKLIWYSETMKSTFIKANEGHNEITTEKLDAFNVVTTMLNQKIAEVEKLKVEIGDFQKALDNKVDKKEGYDLSQNDFTNLLKEKLENLENYNDEEIRDLISGLQNNLTNYYLKSETYNKEEIDNKISLIPKFDIKVVDKLPTENIEEATVYLVKSGEESQNLYTEYIYADGVWEQLGTQKLDLSGFYNKDEINSMLATRDSKIQALENENQSQTARIETLEKENAEQAEELETLWKDYKEKEVEGETVTISDGIGKIKDTIYGMSKQNTTEGYQLIDWASKGTFENDTLSFSSSSAYAGIHYDILDIFLNNAGKTIYFNCESSDFSNSNNGRLQIVYNNGSNVYVVLLSASDKKTSLTIPSDVSNITSARLSLVVNNLNVSGTTYSASIVKPILSFTQIDKYEPYTGGQASPNTEYEQDIEVIEAYNKFNKDDEQLKINKGHYHMNGNRLDNSLYSYLLIEDVKPNTDYHYLGILTAATSDVIVFDFYDNDEYISMLYYSTEKGKTTTPANCNKMYVSIPYTEKDTFQVTENEDKPYLPYGHIGLVQRGKNILKFKETTTKTNSGLTGTANVDGSFKLNGTTTGTVAMGFDIEPYKVKGTYRVSGYTKDGLLQLYWKDKNETIKFKEIRETTPINFTEGDRLFQIFCWTNIAGKTYNNETFYLQLEEGSEATPFETPFYNLIPIDLSGNKLAKVGEIADLLNIDVDGRVSIEKNIYDLLLSDSSVINSFLFFKSNEETGISAFVSYTALNIINKLCKNTTFAGGNVISNRFLSEKYLNLWAMTKAGIDVYNNIILITVPSTIATTDTELRDWLRENLTQVMYPLATPEKIQLPSIEPIKLIEGTNIFELVTNLGTTMKVEYRVSNNSRLEALEDAILSLGGISNV